MKKIISTITLCMMTICVLAAPPKPPAGYKWELVNEYSDEFNGNSLDREKWNNYHWSGWRGRKPAKFVPEAISVKDGYLQIKNGILPNPSDGWKYSGGAVTSVHNQAHFGYYETRFKSSNTRMSTTFWLSNSKVDLPGGCSGDRYSQELDIVESIGDASRWPGFATKMIPHTHFRWVPCQGGREQFLSTTPKPLPLSSRAADEFHTYGAWWHDAKTVTFYADGEAGTTAKFNTTKKSAPFERPMYINMVTETYDWENPVRDHIISDDSRNTSYYDWVRVWKLVSTGSSTQETYPDGIPHSIPGKIEAEHFDIGGEGIAYHDTDIANNGANVMREDEAVDIEFRDGGKNVGWVADGEWLEYTVNVEAGAYDIEVRIATITTGRTIVAKLDDVTLGVFELPNTGDWGNFQTLKIENISMTEGNNKILRLEFVGEGLNLNWIKFSPTPCQKRNCNLY